MKDILKFTLSAFLMLATLTLVSVVFIQAFMSDYDWINLLLTVLYSLLMVAAALYEGSAARRIASTATSCSARWRSAVM